MSSRPSEAVWLSQAWYSSGLDFSERLGKAALLLTDTLVAVQVPSTPITVTFGWSRARTENAPSTLYAYVAGVDTGAASPTGAIDMVSAPLDRASRKAILRPFCWVVS
jgi:hypothetical protein